MDLLIRLFPLLTVIMFSVGLTLSLNDFKRALAMPKLIISGLLLQYTVMPLTAVFSIWHNISGSTLAFIWSKNTDSHPENRFFIQPALT
jgi:predicted Na+-dependent transporter